MAQYLLYILGSFAVSMVCGFLAIPMIVRFCKKKNLYDQPGTRKIHKCGVPRLGGTCFLPSMLLAFLIAMLTLNGAVQGNEITISLWSVCFFVSLLLVYAVPASKFVVQVVAASLLPASGLYINNMYGFLGIYELPYYVGAPLTVFAIVFIDNAMNLIDGIDGLSGGLSLIALGGFLYCFAREGVWTYCILIAGLMGVLVAFLYFNITGGKNNKMKDQYGRTIDYLRISVTDRCNLRCTYCMPEEGITCIPHEEILRYEEMEQICRIMAEMGLKHIKVTGGEPLVRKGISGFIRTLKEIPGIETVTLTTNGILLESMAEELASAGIDGINVSLDTLDEEAFRAITRGGDVKRVLAGLRKMHQYPQITLKINCVLGGKNWKKNHASSS